MHYPLKKIGIAKLLCHWSIAAALLAGSVQAAPNARWAMNPDGSRLVFGATQEGTKFYGVFREFSAGLRFDPADPEGGSISAVIALESVDTNNGERDDYLRQPDWLSVAKWPQATYEADNFRRVGENEYVADGTLTLRGVSQPVRLTFTLELDELQERADMRGTASLKRLDFGVGQGEWSDVSLAGDLVQVTVELRLVRAYE